MAATCCPMITAYVPSTPTRKKNSDTNATGPNHLAILHSSAKPPAPIPPRDNLMQFRSTAALVLRNVFGKGPFPNLANGGGEDDEEHEGKLEESSTSEDEVVAEDLECLEEEAIAGEDGGRDPADYDRRAHLFDDSARVFQALKDKKDDHGHQHRQQGS